MSDKIIPIATRRRTYGAEVAQVIADLTKASREKPPPVAIAAVLLRHDGTADHFYAAGPNTFALIGAIAAMESDVLFTMQTDDGEAGDE